MTEKDLAGHIEFDERGRAYLVVDDEIVKTKKSKETKEEFNKKVAEEVAKQKAILEKEMKDKLEELKKTSDNKPASNK